MFNLFKNFFNYNQRELERLQKQVEEINKMEDKVRVLKDEDFPEETQKLRKLADDQQKQGFIISWGAALVREAARRVLGERHFDVQLMAGLALNEGKIAEQKTGEGKTLSATVPLYINALNGKGAHLVTVNDYLARRDAGWMGSVFHFLGLTTSAIIADKSYIYDPAFKDKEAQDWRLASLKPISRKEAYKADVTYGINSEFGFDYLRDNMAQTQEELVQRDFHFAIVDEADSVLIDEARTPHIISAPYEQDTSKYYGYAKIVRQLAKDDYVIDEKMRTVNLTEAGIAKIESLIGVKNIYEKDFDTLFHIEAALKANTLFKIDKDYIVKDNEVIIVDEFTGRLLYGRRFSEGLHQAIEAKEGVTIQKESKTLATISLQNYFRMYKKLAGMTGTAATEAEEFHKIYKTDVLIIPTHRKMIRKDKSDMIYKTEKGKFDAVVEEIAKNYQMGRPVLVGTTSIEKNEYLSRLLNNRGIPHEVLNAKNHLREAAIIANAGKKSAVTVATNMAGRGVDIILGGTPPEKKNEKAYQEWQRNHDEVVAAGGLAVLGTERHESRRIDNQLRGRAGRQGDPGESIFFVSLEDDLMRIFGGEQISKLMTFFNFPPDQPLTHPMVSKAIEQAQVKVEGFNFDIRKHLVDFDDVLSRQREIIYSRRKDILLKAEKDKASFKETIFEIFNEEVSATTASFYNASETLADKDIDQLKKELDLIIEIEKNELKKHNNIQLSTDFVKSKVLDEFNRREKRFGQELWHHIVRVIFLTTIDKYWTEHLTAIEDLREGINLRGYAQLDPLVEYKNEAFSMFEKLMSDINFEMTRRLFKTEVEAMPQEEKPKEDLVYKSAAGVDPFIQQQQKEQNVSPQYLPPNENKNNDDFGLKIIPPGTKHKKLGRNDLCWCGSGKKYKKCHYPN